MKHQRYICAIILSLFISTSCSVFRPGTDNKQSVQNQTQVQKKTSSGTKRGKRHKTDATNNTTNSAAPETNSPRVFTAADSTAVARQLAGEWFFDNVAGIKVTGENNRPFLTFDENIPRFYASNGCSYFNGAYNITGHNTISFDGIISTANYCGDIKWADYISALWNVATHMYITRKGTEEYLDLRDTKDRSLAVLRRHQLTLLNGMWSVARIENRDIKEDCPVLVIDLPEKTVHGNTGCNLFNGTIYQNPDADSSVQFQNMAVTKMDCPGLAVETAFLVALEQVEKVTTVNDDTAVLADADGQPMLTLRRIQL